LTSFEDIKYGIIKNKYIIFALIYSFIVNLILHFYVYIKQGFINYNYTIQLISNIIFVLIFGGILWYNKFWTAADTKLYVAYTALVPLSIYNFGYIKHIPSITILVNTFLPLSIIYSINVLIKTNMSIKWEILKKVLEPKNFIVSFLFIFSISWIPRLLIDYFNIKISFINTIILILIFSTFIRNTLKEKTTHILVIICIFRLIFDKHVYSLEFFKRFVLLVFIVLVFRSFFLKLGKMVYTKKIKVKDIKKGMILEDTIYKTGKKYKIDSEENIIKKEIEEKKSFNGKIVYFKHTGDGLDDFDIKKIKKLNEQNKLNFKFVNINKITPFAQYMFFGVLFTLFFKGNIITTFFEFNLFINEYLINSILQFSFILLIGISLYVFYFKLSKKSIKV
jgi:peptidase A24-like protein